MKKSLNRFFQSFYWPHMYFAKKQSNWWVWTTGPGWWSVSDQKWMKEFVKENQKDIEWVSQLEVLIVTGTTGP